MNSTQSLHSLISRRIEYFTNNGLRSKTNFKAKVDRLDSLTIDPIAFNRILFSLFSSILKSQGKEFYVIETTNCSQYFTLSLSYKRSGFLPPQNGIFSPRKQSTNYFNSVLACLKESGGNLTFSKFHPLRDEIRLQIPLTLNSETNKTSGSQIESLFFDQFFKLCETKGTWHLFAFLVIFEDRRVLSISRKLIAS